MKNMLMSMLIVISGQNVLVNLFKKMWHAHWNANMPTGIEPRTAGCKSAALTTIHVPGLYI